VGTAPAQVGDDCTAGTEKSLLLKMIVALFNGPVTRPVRRIERGPIVHDKPYSPVLPLTLASRLTAKPSGEFTHEKPPVMLPGCATNGTFGSMPGIIVSCTESDPKI
jgi:hypothetical protein